MNKITNKFIFIKIILLLVSVLLVSCGRNYNTAFDTKDEINNANEDTINYNDILKLPREYMSGVYLFNMDNLSELIGYVDYVFVGKVIEYERTDYRYPVDKYGRYYEINDPAPLTVYKVEVLKNIKNELKQSIELIKEGGLSKDKKAIVVNEDSSLYEINCIYIFYGIAQPDGSLSSIGKDKFVKLNFQLKDDNDKSKLFNELDNNSIYLKVIEALSDEKVYYRKRSIANDDIVNTIDYMQ